MKRVVLAALCMCAAFGAGAAKAPQKTLPSYMTLPKDVFPSDGQDSIIQEDYGVAEFYNPGSDAAVEKRGRHWHVNMTVSGVPDTMPGKQIWNAKVKQVFVSQGWNVSVEYDSNPFSAMVRRQKDGKDVWGYIKIFGRDDLRMDIVEAGGPPQTLVAAPPAATPQKVSVEKGDFPYLPPLPGSTDGSGGRESGPMTVEMPGSEEPQVVGNGYLVRNYNEPPGLSTVLFVSQYHNALTKAGWTIIQESAGASQTDATLTAHYAKNGRNIWAYLHNGGGNYSIQVADAGAADDLAKQLGKACHVALYGVLFDFNKSTLKPDSDPVLQNVLGILQKDAGLKVEVQGHTDNVGNDAYNQKLSEARAKSVVAWLTGHGIAADRLTFKGYGKTVPVASNDDDAGRAKNRRVEIAKPGCAPKH
ncbi:MAG: OmpA family protein [Alphaproteobacteria bacterium]|nr:OmpA family protein [Alphaproteobacteria bacterium]